MYILFNMLPKINYILWIPSHVTIRTCIILLLASRCSTIWIHYNLFDKYPTE